MLERVWRKGNPLTQLVGMQIDITPLENNMEIPLKTRNKTTYNMTQQSHYWASTLRKPELKKTHGPYPSVHCRTIYNS